MPKNIFQKMLCMSKILLHLETLVESIDKIEQYSSEFDNAEEFYYDSKSFDATMM